MNQKETEEFLRNIAGAIDDILEETFEERISFALLIFNADTKISDKSRVNYISNCDRKDMIKALRSTLIRWEAGSDDPITGKQNPTHN